MSEKITFEASVMRLEEIVRLLERGDAPLDESLKLFEEGTALISGCSKMLENAEQTVLKLTKKSDGTLEETRFDGEEE
ncbi:MAG: exodeoxyribonuclease VII small subunit [Clostridia bacterium]|nr:exodeoxyribonuclease VII small subunit [Clostridia bacterium]